MPAITFIPAGGPAVTLNGEVGQSAMEVARRHDVPGILAECGGACACATCHVMLAHGWAERLPAAAADEQDMLAFAHEAGENSRLSCQIRLTAALDGLVLHVPARQR